MSLIRRVSSPCAVGIVGATGLVGELLLAILAERAFPVRELRLFASARSAGKSMRWRDRDIVVEDAAKADYAGLDVVFFSAGAETSRELAPRVASGRDPVFAGRLRRDPTVPHGLVLFVTGDNLRKGAALNAIRSPSAWSTARRADDQPCARLAQNGMSSSGKAEPSYSSGGSSLTSRAVLPASPGPPPPR